MSFELDFVRDRYRVQWPGILLLAAGVMVAGYCAHQYLTIQARVAELEASNVAAARKAVSRERTGTDVNVEQLRARLLAARQVIETKTASWDALFRDIESASDQGIGLIAIQPELGPRRITISGDARDAAALARYLQRLGKKPSLDRVHLTGHELRQEQGRMVIRFRLNAIWAGGVA